MFSRRRRLIALGAVVLVVALGIVLFQALSHRNQTPHYGNLRSQADVVAAGNKLNAHFAKKYDIRSFVSKPYNQLQTGEAAWYDIRQMYYSENHGRPFVKFPSAMSGTTHPQGYHVMLIVRAETGTDTVTLQTPCNGGFSKTAPTSGWADHLFVLDGTQQSDCLSAGS